MSKATQARDRIGSRPGALAALGALAGGTLGMALGRKAKKSSGEHREERRYYEYRPNPWETSGQTWTSETGYTQPGYAPPQAGYGYEPQRGEAGFARTFGSTYEGRPDYTASPEAGSWSEPWRSQEAERSWQHAEEPSRGEQFKQKGQEWKERATHKTQDFKERASHKAHDVKERMSEKTDHLRHRADEMRHRMQEKRESSSHGPGLKERMPSPGELREKIPSAGELHHKAQRRPMGTILGGALLGIAAASLLPLTRKERKVMHPAKERAREEFGEQMHRVEEKFGMGGEHEQESSRGGRQESFRGGESGAPEEFRGTRGYGAPVGSGTSSTGTSWGGPEATSRSDETIRGGSYPSGGTRQSSGTGGFPTTQPSDRESLGLRSGEAQQPYRQPSFAEQLEDEDKVH